MSGISRIDFNSAAFRNMYKLRLLKIFCSDVRKKCEVSIDQGNCDLLFLPNSLRYLHWEDYPWKYFPPRFRPENLVELIMPDSKVEKLWEAVQVWIFVLNLCLKVCTKSYSNGIFVTFLTLLMHHFSLTLLQ